MEQKSWVFSTWDVDCHSIPAMHEQFLSWVNELKDGHFNWQIEPLLPKTDSLQALSSLIFTAS